MTQAVQNLPDGQALIVMIAAVIVLILALVYNARWYQPPEITHEGEAHGVVRAEAAPLAASDDLTLIEGIGPKIAALLQGSGIDSFTRLAETDPALVKELLRKGGLYMADPETWSKQARLAAAGEWEEFKAFTDQLKAGRST